MSDTAFDPKAATPATDEEWNAALARVREIEGDRFDRVFNYARSSWAASVVIDYDEGPSAICFIRDDKTYWYVIDDEHGCSWDDIDPTSLLVDALLDDIAALAIKYNLSRDANRLLIEENTRYGHPFDGDV